MTQVKFPVTAGSPSLRLFRGQQQRQVKMFFVVAVSKSDEISVIPKILSLSRAVIHSHIFRVAEPRLQHIAQIVEALSVVIARHHDHLHRSDLAQTVNRAHQQLPSAQERFLVTDRLVLRRPRRGRAAEMIGVQKIIPAHEQDFLRGQRRRFGQQILQREDEHALENIGVVSPAGFQLGTAFSEVVVHDGNLEQPFGACAMKDRWLDRRGLTELLQYPLHEVLEFFLGNFAPQPRLTDQSLGLTTI